MLRLIAACAILSFAISAHAEDRPKPNTLTPKEIADGWILLFDGETTFGWKIDGAAEVKNGVLKLTAGKTAAIMTPTASFGEYDLQMETADGPGSFEIETARGTLSSRISSRPMKLIASVRIEEGASSFGNNVHIGPDMVPVATPQVTSDGPAQFRIEVPAHGAVSIKSLKIKPINTTSLFTGKNLDGWKVNAADPKRMTSKWDVTKDGELSVKNGPGDLVSTQEFDNFVLQFECKTNGKALNSGIFFRCMPGQYQNGYEAQIQNAFKDDDRTKPLDFGTGAIYRRIPSRKVVSNDHEWFTMTVVANGKHISTWVNGYQTVDWTDDRKENANPRQGYRAAKGPFSIQGHDPTTDILFRNIRVAELDGEKKKG